MMVSMFRRKHYAFITCVIRDAEFPDGSDLTFVVDVFEKAFVLENKDFNRARFRSECGVGK